MIEALAIEQAGAFNTGETKQRWRPFVAAQRMVVRGPGFDWDARIRLAPGLSVGLHDAYIAGEGVLYAKLLGWLPMLDLRGAPEVGPGQLLRFLAEAPLYPTALLPGHGITWEAVDDGSAQATLADGATVVSVRFHFDDEGLIRTAHAAARGRTVGRTVIPTPWEGRWNRYELKAGMRVPLEGEVAWLLAGGLKPYLRGRVTRLNYEFAQEVSPV